MVGQESNILREKVQVTNEKKEEEMRNNEKDFIGR